MYDRREPGCRVTSEFARSGWHLVGRSGPYAWLPARASPPHRSTAAQGPSESPGALLFPRVWSCGACFENPAGSALAHPLFSPPDEHGIFDGANRALSDLFSSGKHAGPARNRAPLNSVKCVLAKTGTVTQGRDLKRRPGDPRPIWRRARQRRGRTIEPAANRSCHRADAEPRWAVVPSRARFHRVSFSKEVQRERNARKNQQQIDHRIRGQMKRAFEDPTQQQNHSDNYEHVELPVTPEPGTRAFLAPIGRETIPSFAKLRGEILRRAGNVPRPVRYSSRQTSRNP
jgi:hypothetical protein